MGQRALMGARVMPAAATLPRMGRYFRPRCRVVLGALLAAPGARAADEQISWSAPAECGDASRVAAAVAELTGRPLSELAPDLRVQAVVERRASGWSLSLATQDGIRQGSRQITAPSCAELTRAAAVALALALDRDAEGDALEMEEQPDAAAAADAIPVEPAPTLGNRAPADEGGNSASPAPTGAASELGWQLELGVLLDGSALVEPAPGIELALGASVARLAAMLYGAWLPAQRTAVDDGGSVAFSLLIGGLRVCQGFVTGPIGASACGSIEVGRLTARGEELDNAASYSDWWLAPSLALALDARLGGPLYLRGFAGAVVPVLRETYRVDESTFQHRPPSVGLRGGLALGVALGGPD